MSALLLFPAEVWEMVLERMKDSKDVLNAFQAFPELEVEGVLRKKKHLWLFDQVIPHLVPWLKSKEILACRQVCTQWTWAVDNFNDNHPFKRAYEHGSSITGQLWIPDASCRAKYRLQLPIQLKKFTNAGSIHVYSNARFISDMELHPKERTPFVGRFMEIQTHSHDYRLPNSISSLDILLQKYGNHLWFLKTALANALNWDNLLTWLSHLPNLKSLELSEQRQTWLREGNKERYSDSREYSFPPLLHLETLVFGMESLPLPNYVIRFFVTSYSLQIRRLTILVALWENEYSNLFPNLTELELQIKGKGRGKAVDDILAALNSPRLYTLQLLFHNDFNPHFHFYCLRIFPVISKQFLQLNSFSLSYSSPEANRLGLLLPSSSPSDPALSIPSLKSLVLWNRSNNVNDNEISYDWLKCFPSLEYLKISAFIADGVDMTRIWSSLPKLRGLTLKDKGHVERSYRRDTRR